MATAPATGAQADALIMALRGATPMQGQASTIKFYDNPQNSVYTPRERPVYGGMPSLPPGPPMGPFLPPPSAPVAPSPVAPSPSPVAPAPRPIVYPAPRVTDPDVPDYTDDLWGDPQRFKFKANIGSYQTITELNVGQQRSLLSERGGQPPLST